MPLCQRRRRAGLPGRPRPNRASDMCMTLEEERGRLAGQG